LSPATVGRHKGVLALKPVQGHFCLDVKTQPLSISTFGLDSKRISDMGEVLDFPSTESKVYLIPFNVREVADTVRHFNKNL
jgi:hypothetical protein